MKKTSLKAPVAAKKPAGTTPAAARATAKTGKPVKKTVEPYKNYILGVLLLVTAAVYWPSLKNDFVAGDDYTIVVNNADIRSFDNLPKFFAQPYHSMYCPVKMISHAIDYKFSGSKPDGYHFFSLLYHLINVALLFSLIYLLFSNVWGAVVGALLFAVHPINAETVCWLTGRGDLLYAGFYFGGLITYIKYLKNNLQSRYLVFTLLLFVLSGLSKASAMTFPLTLLVLDWFYRRRLFSWRVALEKAPFFLGALALGLSAIALRSGHSVPASEYLKHFTGIDNFVIFIYPLTFYLAKFFVPLKLALPYPHPFASNLPLSFDFYLFPFLLLALVVLIWRCPTLRRPLTFACLFYLTGLVSAMRLSPMLGTIAADRYFYVAMAGVVLFAAWAFVYLSEHRALLNRRAFSLFLTVFVLFSVTMAGMTRARTYAFKDAITLFGDAHNKYPAHATPLYELTGGYMQTGNTEMALQTAQKITQLLPNDEGAWGFRTNLNLSFKRYPDALNSLNRLIQIDPDNKNYRFSKAALLAQQFNQPDSVLAETEALMRPPVDSALYVDAIKLRVNSFAKQQNYDGIVAAIDTLFAHYPTAEPGLLTERARAEFERKNMAAAIENIRRLLQLQPENGMAHLNLGNIYAASGNLAEACKCWQKAAEYNPAEAAEVLKNCR
jgi:Flp pilus assembly protein TadD